MNVAAPILDVLAREPDRLGVGQPGGSVSYGELRRQIVATSLALQQHGLTPGDRVLLQVPNGPLFATSALAVLLAGGVPVLMEPGLGETVYRSRVRAAAPGWLLVHPLVLGVHHTPGLRGLLGRRDLDVPPVPDGIPHRVVLSQRRVERWARRLPRDTSFHPVDRSADAEGVLVFTGGTTQTPRGVQLSHQALDRYLARIQTVIEQERIDRFLADTPQQVLYALRLGRTAFVTRGRKQRRAAHVLSLVRDGTVDAYFGSPYVWVEMMSAAGPGRERLPDTLRTVILGSAPVTPTFLADLRGWLAPDTRVLTVYGLTEAGPVCVASVGDKLDWEHSGSPGDYVGTPLPGVRLEVAVREGTAGLRENEPPLGEVIVHSSSLYAGYLGEPPRPPGEGLRTGDLGRLVERPDGRPGLVLLGRQKDMILRRGVNLYPASLEPPLRALRRPDGRPLLRDVALVGLWNPVAQDEEVVLIATAGDPQAEKGAIRGGASTPRDMEALRQAAARALGPDGAPDHVILVPELPVTGRQNKVDKVALRQLAAHRLHLDAGIPGHRPGSPVRSPHAVRADTQPRHPPTAGLVVPYNWRNFRRKVALMARSDGLSAAGGQAAFRVALWAVGQAGWALDRLESPAPTSPPFLGPIFIIGHQRSGTTFLHRLLASDQTHARALRLHEMLLPATSLQRGLARLGRTDRRRLGNALSKTLDVIQEHLFGPLDDIHRLRFDEVEEDEFVFWALFEGIMCANDAPASTASGVLEDLRRFDAWPPERRIRALGWYRACIEKKLQREPSGTPGEPLWPVSKNPAFTQRIPAVRDTFPGARFLYLVRNPLQAIPSRLHLIRAIWRRRVPGFGNLTPDQVQTILQDSVRTYLSAERDLPALPPEAFLRVRHETLRNSPRAVVERAYRHFALPGPDRHLLAALAEAERRPRRSERPPPYSLSEFGLDAADLRTRLTPVFDRYGFDESPAGSSRTR